MEAVFSLPYPEYVVAEEVRTHLRKAKGYAVCIPLSRQQKGMDLLVHNMKTKRSATIQVRSSRAYLGRPKKTDPPEGPFDYYLWFNAFDPSESPADFYALARVTTHPRPWQHRLPDESVVQLEHSLAARGVRRAKN